MRQDGSAREGVAVPAASVAPAALPAWLAPIVVVLGMAAMAKAAPYAMRHGLRPGLVLSELTLALPGLLASFLLRRPVSALVGTPPRSTSARWLPLLYGASLWVLSLGLLELQYALRPPPAGY